MAKIDSALTVSEIEAAKPAKTPEEITKETEASALVTAADVAAKRGGAEEDYAPVTAADLSGPYQLKVGQGELVHVIVDRAGVVESQLWRKTK